MISLPALSAFIVAGILGLCSYPLLQLGRWVAAKVIPVDAWIHIFLAVVIWFLAMYAVVGILNQFNFGPMSLENRRHHAIYLFAGFFAGMYGGGWAYMFYQNRNK